MRKTILWKDAFQAITHSLGRYIAIILLIGLGTFAFTGLKMAGPDMRATGADFFNKHNLADVTVTSNYGINSPIEWRFGICRRLSKRVLASFNYVEQHPFAMVVYLGLLWLLPVHLLLLCTKFHV